MTLSPGLRPRPLVLHYERLVLALGGVTDLGQIRGVREHAFAFRNLADALRLRNHLVGVLEQAAIEADAELRRRMLTFVVVGGGFSGTEIVAEINDLVRRAARAYRSVPAEDIRVVLVHSGARTLEHEVTPQLSSYTTDILRRRGVELMMGSSLDAASADAAVLADGRRIPTRTIVCTVPSAAHPLARALGLPMQGGRIRTDETLRVEGRADVWAVGDCASVPHPGGAGACPPTAQYAVRQARVAADNVVASIRGGRAAAFAYSGRGKMGALGHHRAVAELPGGLRLSGLPAWVVWRAFYWSKLPGLDRRLRVALSWLADLAVQPELVQLDLAPVPGVARAHFDVGEVVFRQGDLADHLYMILDGEAEIVQESPSGERVLTRLGPGDYFGEIALLGKRPRSATVRCVTDLDVLTLRGSDFGALVAQLPDLRRSFERVMEVRLARDRREGGSRRGD